MTPLTPEERGRKVFDASIGCTAAAVEFLRSVNKPLNVTYIANTAWEIARKLEELMETFIKASESSTDGVARAAPAHVQREFNTSSTVPKPLPQEDLIDLDPVPSGTTR